MEIWRKPQEIGNVAKLGTGKDNLRRSGTLAASSIKIKQKLGISGNKADVNIINQIEDDLDENLNINAFRGEN